MEGVKQKITKTWSRVSQKALKGAEEGGWKFCLEELIKISMKYVYIMPEVIKK